MRDRFGVKKSQYVKGYWDVNCNGQLYIGPISNKFDAITIRDWLRGKQDLPGHLTWLEEDESNLRDQDRGGSDMSTGATGATIDDLESVIWIGLSQERHGNMEPCSYCRDSARELLRVVASVGAVIAEAADVAMLLQEIADLRALVDPELRGYEEIDQAMARLAALIERGGTA